MALVELNCPITIEHQGELTLQDRLSTAAPTRDEDCHWRLLSPREEAGSEPYCMWGIVSYERGEMKNQIIMIMMLPVCLLTLTATHASAECQIADAKLEEAISKRPELHGSTGRQAVRDLRSLRDAAFTLWSYGRQAECERLVATIRELVSGPPMGSLGGNDEEDAEAQMQARQPQAARGGTKGVRDQKGAKPLISIEDLDPGMRADEIIGAEVRSADDRIVGEVRNVVFGAKDRRDYAIVASGGFFTPGKDSIVVPIRSLKVSQDRGSFFLPVSEARVKTIPLMPDQDYAWLGDEAWRDRNDALFTAR